MIKALLAGAVIGIVGKKLFDEGKLDPYIERVRTKVDELGLVAGGEKVAAAAKKAAA